MLEGLQSGGREWRSYRAVTVSVAAHLALLAVIVFQRPKAIELQPTWLAYGDGAHTYKLTYIPPTPESEQVVDPGKLIFPHDAVRARRRLRAQAPRPVPTPQPVIASAEDGDRNSKAGSPLGTMIDGPITGHEVHVAYPTVFPDPPVNRAELPRDLAGDVVIEVTIDSQGNVVETKIVQAIGHGIDEKIEATLRRWHYQPATLDGTPVASRHDVHFHFPS